MRWILCRITDLFGRRRGYRIFLKLTFKELLKSLFLSLDHDGIYVLTAHNFRVKELFRLQDAFFCLIG